jgi:mono/diheme cytochrome c family protein
MFRFLCVLIFCGLLFTSFAWADTYAPKKTSPYLCVQTGVSVEDPVGKISLRSKTKGKKIAGKATWNYAALQKALKKAGKNKSLKKSLQGILKVLYSCYDKRFLPRPGTTPSPTPTPPPPSLAGAFAEVAPILQANCMGCHATRGWVMEENYFLDNDFVEPGVPGLSRLYRYLRGNPEAYSPGSMPPMGNPISSSDVAVIRNWIVGLGGPPNPGATPTPTVPPGHFGCIPSTQIAANKMKRISKTQLYNSTRDLLIVGSIGSSMTDAILGTYEWSEWRLIPEDYSALGHNRLDDRLDEAHLEGLVVLFDSIIGRLQSYGRLDDLVTAYVPSCNSTNYQTVTCREEFLRRFGRRVTKAPLNQADFDFYRSPDGAGVSQASIREIMLALLSSPRFLYFLEDKGTPVDSSGLVLRISPREYITRLAYTVWNTIPDDQLVTFAENGTVDSNPAQVVSYVLDTQAAKSRVGLRDFFDGWLKVHHSIEELARYMEWNSENHRLLSVDYGGSDLPLVTDPNNASATANALRAYKSAAADEVVDIGAILTVYGNGTIADLFRTRIAPASDETLRRAYNLSSLWDGNINNIPLAPATRAGILTRPGMLLSSGQRNRTILRGARLRDVLLCDSTGLPTNNANPPGTQTNSYAYVTGSTQNRVRTITEQAGTQCASCHMQWINPLGFLMEEFDSNGRRRHGGQEVVFEMPPGPNQSVTEFRNNIDTVLAPYVNRNDSSTVSGVAGLSERIATSTEMQACYVRNVVRFAFNRVESDAWDGCFMNEMLSNTQNTSMKEVLRRLFLSPSYRLRRLNEIFTGQ